MFLGTFRHQVDGKGRFRLPTKFKAELGESPVFAKGANGALYVLSRKELEENIADHRVVITHTDFPEGAEIVKQKLTEKFGNLRFEVRVVNPTNGCHAGPDCVSISFHAKHR